jgi:hypothetical protein
MQENSLQLGNRRRRRFLSMTIYTSEAISSTVLYQSYSCPLKINAQYLKWKI